MAHIAAQRGKYTSTGVHTHTGDSICGGVCAGTLSLQQSRCQCQHVTTTLLVLAPLAVVYAHEPRAGAHTSTNRRKTLSRPLPGHPVHHHQASGQLARGRQYTLATRPRHRPRRATRPLPIAPRLHPPCPTLTLAPRALFLVVPGHAHTIRIAVLGLGARKARRDLVKGWARVPVGIRLGRIAYAVELSRAAQCVLQLARQGRVRGVRSDQAEITDSAWRARVGAAARGRVLQGGSAPLPRQYARAPWA